MSNQHERKEERNEPMNLILGPSATCGSADSPAATTPVSGSSNGGFSREVSLTTLSSEEAVRLLVSLGCAADLRQRVDAMMGMIDGSFLMEIDDIDVFYELEQTVKTAIRTTHYRKVLKKLQALQQVGEVSQAVLQSLRDQDGMILPIIEADTTDTPTLRTQGTLPAAASETLQGSKQKAITVDNEADDEATAVAPTPLPRPETPPAAAVQTLPVLSVGPSSTVSCGVGESENRCNATSAVGGDVVAVDAARYQIPTSVAPAGGAKGITDTERDEIVQRIAALQIRETVKEQLRRLLRNDPTLTTLDLRGNKIGDAGAIELASMLRANTTLATLHLSYSCIGAAGASELASMLRVNQTLTALYLRENSIGTAGATEVASALGVNTTLMTLDLGHNAIKAAGATEVASMLRMNQTLTALDLGHNDIGTGGAKEMASALLTNTTLVTLDLNNNRIGTVGATELFSMLRVNTTLTTLDLGHNDIGVAGATEAALMLRVNTTLVTLSLFSNGIGAAGATEAASMLRANTTLTTLDLGHNDIGVAGATEIASALQANTTLTTLILNGNSVSDAGATELASMLRANTTLMTLDLRNNRIGAAGATELASMLRANTTLTSLDVYGNNIGAAFNVLWDVGNTNGSIRIKF